MPGFRSTVPAYLKLGKNLPKRKKAERERKVL
jgi:hypothetical protein